MKSIIKINGESLELELARKGGAYSGTIATPGGLSVKVVYDLSHGILAGQTVVENRTGQPAVVESIAQMPHVAKGGLRLSGTLDCVVVSDGNGGTLDVPEGKAWLWEGLLDGNGVVFKHPFGGFEMETTGKGSQLNPSTFGIPNPVAGPDHSESAGVRVNLEITDGDTAKITSVMKIRSRADLDDDGDVDGADITKLLGAWKQAGPLVMADLDKNGVVDGADLSILLGSWTGEEDADG